MRYGLAFYELDGPLFALESGRRHMSLYIAEQDVVVKHKEALPGVNASRSLVRFSDLNRLPLDIVEKIVRDSVAARRVRAGQGQLLTQAELLKLWAIKEEAVQVPVVAKTPGRVTTDKNMPVELSPDMPAVVVADPIKATKSPTRRAAKSAGDPVKKTVARSSAVSPAAAAPEKRVRQKTTA
jgi:hypothetical protein